MFGMEGKCIYHPEHFINISSVEGQQANKANVSHYITHKHAMNGFTKACAFEYGPLGITTNAISPGGVETDMMMEAGPLAAESMGISYEEFKDNYAQEATIKRLNTVDEVAAMALLLASDAGSGINGAIARCSTKPPPKGRPVSADRARAPATGWSAPSRALSMSTPS